MKDYYNLFIELSLQQCTKNDYADKLKVKLHNTVSKKIIRLKNEMKQFDSKEVLCMLLDYEDDRVKLNAASLCLEMNILREQAVAVLEKIIDLSKDSTICFSAKMLLQSANN